MIKVARRAFAAVLLASLVALLPGPMASATGPHTPGVDYVYDATNDYRVAHGQGALAFETNLQMIAQAWAEQMAADYAGGMSLANAFRHNTSMTSQIPSGWQSAGENIAYNGGYPAPFAKLMEQWDLSAPHKANMLNPNWTAMGIGVYTDASGLTWGVQVFAKYATAWVPPVITLAAPLTPMSGSSVALTVSVSPSITATGRVWARTPGGRWIASSTTVAVANGAGSATIVAPMQAQEYSVHVQGVFSNVVTMNPVNPILTAYQGSGGSAGPWGSTASVASLITSPSGTGLGQNFANGQALSSAAGTFFVPTRIQAVHGANGWVRGALGWPTANAVCDGAGACTQQFQGGAIATPAGTGAGYVMETGPIAVAHQAAGGNTGPWGPPTSSSSSITSPSGTGLGQNFANGQALSSAAGTFFVPSRIQATLGANGWVRGALGWPTANAVCDGSGACTQAFQGGSIAIPAGSGAGYVVDTGPIAVAHQAAGGNAGPWGSPTSSASSLSSPNGNGQGQNFANGQALSSAAGTFFVPTRIKVTHGVNGWVRGTLGWPTANAVCDGSGACTQAFQGGSIAMPAGSGPGYVVDTGPIAVAHQASGGNAGPWGSPTSSSSALSSPNGSGQGQNFANGQALSSAAGTFFVPTRIQAVHGVNGWVRGALGWPIANAVCDGSGACTQAFQGGSIAMPAGSEPGYVVDTGPIAVAHQASGGNAGPWGSPTSSASFQVTVNGNGQGQNFANGQALSSAAGTFFVPTRIKDVHGANGWIRGTLGWPTTNAVCDGSGACTQAFQGGMITTPSGSGPGTISLN